MRKPEYKNKKKTTCVYPNSTVFPFVSESKIEQTGFGFFTNRGRERAEEKKRRGGLKRSFKQRVNYKSRFHEANAITRPGLECKCRAPHPPIEKRLTNKPWKRGSSRYLQPPVFVIIPRRCICRALWKRNIPCWYLSCDAFVPRKLKNE